MRRRTIALIIVAVIFISVGTTYGVVYSSWNPPFPVLWTDNQPSAFRTGNVVEGNIFYWLGLTSSPIQVSTNSSCNYQIVAYEIGNGSIVWRSPSIQIYNGGICLNEPARIFYTTGEIFFVNYGFMYMLSYANGTNRQNNETPQRPKLALIGFNAVSGKTVSSIFEPLPGSPVSQNGSYEAVFFDQTGFLATSGATMYAGYVLPVSQNNPNNSTVLLEALSLLGSQPVLWNNTLEIPSKLSGLTGEPGLYMGSNRLAITLKYSQQLFLMTFDTSAGKPLFHGFVPSNQSPNVFWPAAFINDTLYYLTNKSGDWRIYGVRDPDGSLVENFSVSQFPFASSCDSGFILTSVGNRIIYSGGCPAQFASYTSNGNLIWSDKINIDNTGMYAAGPFVFSNRVGLLSTIRDYFHNSNYNVLYDSFALVNVSSGKVLWSRDYSPIILPPITGSYPPPIYIPLLSSGDYLIFQSGNNIGCANMSQLI